MLILLNPTIPSVWATKHIKKGGFILSNNYHNNASQLYDASNEFELFGALDFIEKDRRKGYNKAKVSRDLEGLFQEVKNISEFEQLRPEEFEFTMEFINHMVNEGHIKIDKNAPLEEKWKEYRSLMNEGMPFRRTAEMYIFRKK